MPRLLPNPRLQGKRDLTATLTGKTKLDNVGQKRTLATATTRFGIRQAELTGVPDYILKAQVVSLNVPGIIAQLTAGADAGTPVSLTLGTRQITLQPVRQELLAFGVELPNGLGRPLVFDGQLVDAQGNVGRSLVTFTATGPNNQLGAMVQFPLAGLQGINTLWVAPLTAHR